jgi:hypothetical protein
MHSKIRAYYRQCCGSGRFLTGSESGSHFRKRPDQDLVLDPDPDLNKFSGKFRLENFFGGNML